MGGIDHNPNIVLIWNEYYSIDVINKSEGSCIREKTDFYEEKTFLNEVLHMADN